MDLYLTKEHNLYKARAADIVPLSPVKRTMNAAQKGELSYRPVVQDVGNLAGIQLEEEPTPPSRHHKRHY